MLTGLGKLLRRYRLRQGELLYDMANNLGVSPSALSAVEAGKAQMPESWFPSLRECYSLTSEQEKELRIAAAKSYRPRSV